MFTRLRGLIGRLVLVVCGWGLLVGSSARAGSFVEFETGQVRPLALSPDGTRLFAVNTPDNRLEVFTVGMASLTHVASVTVGMEPCAVAARNNSEVWVVNHLSDSISVVDVSTSPPHVTRTLLVGDEPRDIVFGGSGGDRAFVTTAHRGQNSSVNPPDLITPGIGRADVWVFDATDLGTSLGGTPLTVVTLFGDTPRALAVSPDGNTVYAAIFQSGNRTTTIGDPGVPNGGQSNGGLPAPNTNYLNQPQPEVGLVVKFNGTHWVDELSRSWDSQVPFSLPDRDVFLIDATANPPAAIAGPTGYYTGVGTVLFNMVVNPGNGKVYVANSDAQNDKRFEGPGTYAGHSVRGHLHESRITVLSGGVASARHLNKHINYGSCCATNPNAENAASLAFPQGMAVTADGATLYVAALGSSKVGVFDTTEIEADTFTPGADQIPVSGGGPTGLVLDEARAQLYVLTRFDNAISVVNTNSQSEVDHVPLYNPEPASIVNGRRFLYDASYTSSHGDSACASCHIFGDFDSLAWDLGNPDGQTITNPGPFRINLVPPGTFRDFAPMKGPMTTQSLRGMANHGPMHWRGDRTGGNDVGGSTFDSAAAFKKFNVAFGDLLGRSGPLTTAEMQAFTDFILQVTYPPNPIRALDNSLTSDQQAGRNFYFGQVSDTVFNCNGCHVLDPAAGHFGSDGQSTFESETQFFKVAHLRNAYQKIGMFAAGGPQVRGFGFLHDGSVASVFDFLHAMVFTFPSDTTRRQVEQFVLAYDSNLAPIVGQQITLSSANAATVGTRIDLLIARAAAAECDVVVKGTVAGTARGWYRTSGGYFRSDRLFEPLLTDAGLRAIAGNSGQELTYTCVPPGSGIRVGVDRDEDNFFDQDEADAGTNPANGANFPAACGNSVRDVGEQCDDGNVLGGDGCSATCKVESGRTLQGTAKGGSIDVVVDGVAIHVVTSAGQNAAQVVANIVAAMNGNAELSAMRTRATAVGNGVLVGGSLLSWVVNDSGISPPSGVPALPPWGAPTLGLLLLAGGALVVARRPQGAQEPADPAHP
ncbi:MAG TPA: beta-propeller fold lactonase family protein [Candidatus Binatia bacterium]|nr:beta-propeller fold lactonase family protein [Candidatus Binatia bacterium]